MPTVVTYYRVSTDEQALKDLSIAAQRKIVMSYITDHGDHTFLQEFVDEGESGYAPAERRPGFMAMLEFCKRNKVELVLVYKFCRFSRFQEESVGYKAIIRRMGGKVRSVSEPTDPDTAAGFLYEGMIEVINQFYSMNLGADTHRGMKENAERGFVNGGRTPYGYRIAKVEGNNGEAHGRLVPGPEQEVAVVREVFDLAVHKGMGCRQIINVLNRRGEPAPNGPHWTVGTVNFMLNNRVYVGDTIWGKTRKKGREQRQRNAPERQTLVENTHAPLIDRALFEERARHARARPFTAPASPASPTMYLLTRLLRCDHCKSTWSVQRQNYKDKDGNKRVRIAYYCNGYLSKGKEVCPSLPIPVTWADGVVLDVLRAHLCDPATLATLDEQAQARIQALREKYGTDGRALRHQLSALDLRIARYIDAIGAGVDLKVCQAEIEKARARKAAIEAQAEVIQHEDYCTTALEKNRVQVARFADALRGDFTRLPMPVQRRVLLYFIRDLVVVDRKELVIETIVPFDNAGLDQLLDEIETVETAEQVEGAAADQSLSFSDRSGHGRGDQEWLQTLGRTGNQCQPLESWSVDTRLPHHPAFGIQCEPPPVEVLERPALTELSSPDEEPATVGDAWSPRLQAIRDRLAQARGWKRWLAEAPDRRPVDVAKHEGLSRARVSQMMRLLDLAPEVVWDLERPDRAGPVPSEKQLREVAMIADPFEQVRQYKAMLANAPAEQPSGEEPEAVVPAVQVLNVAPLEVDAPPVAPVHVRGFQHLFERARRYHEMMDGESVRSVVEIARLEGVSPSRVSQLLYLLQLAPPIVAVLDVPEALCPPVTHKEILGIARMKSKSQQIKAFWGLVSAAPAWGEGMAAK